jgi:hypothetical protein
LEVSWSNVTQGYHDILSVLYLTLVPPRPLPPRSRTTSSSTRSRASTTGPDTTLPDSPRKMNEDMKNLSRAPETAFHGKYDTLGPAVDLGRETAEWKRCRDCAEAISLCRVRDAMGKGMEPMMGLLKYVHLLFWSFACPCERLRARLIFYPGYLSEYFKQPILN